MDVEINTDAGEGFGDLAYGDDAGLMPFVTSINVACGFHGGDPATIARTLDLAQRHGVRVGAHPSLPDGPGFGRREMALARDEMRDVLIYQIGALEGFLKARGMALSHVKPHGKAYAMSRENPEIAAGMLDAVAVFGVPLIGMAGSQTERQARVRGLPFRVEYYVDMSYRDDGGFSVRKNAPFDPALAARQALRLAREGWIETEGGGRLTAAAEVITLHNDMPNAAEVARAVRAALAG